MNTMKCGGGPTRSAMSAERTGLRGGAAWLRMLVSAGMLCALAAGCARQPGVLHQTRALLAEQDDFGLLLVNVGLAPEQLPVGDEVSFDEARRLRLLARLASMGSLRAYAPRLTTDVLLEEVLATKTAVPRSRLNERLRQYQHAVVMRPDGFFATALTGAALQCVGPVEIRKDVMVAGDYQVGVFYVQEASGYRRADDSLQLPPVTLAADVDASTP